MGALLFVIYLDVVMQDHQCMNDQMRLHKRYITQPREEVHTYQLLQHIERAKAGTNVQAESAITRTTIPDPSTQGTAARADAVIYAGDTNMIAELDKTTQISQKLVN